jgi:hypothetical protein
MKWAKNEFQLRRRHPNFPLLDEKLEVEYIQPTRLAHIGNQTHHFALHDQAEASIRLLSRISCKNSPLGV